MDGYTPYDIELATAFRRGDDERKYNDMIKANENYMNQNFKNMAAEIASLRAIIKILTEGT